MSRPKKWTEEQLKTAVKNSYSLRQVLKKLGLSPAGGNYVQLQKYLALLSIDTTHFSGKGWNKGLSGIYKTPVWKLEEVLVEYSEYQSYKLKKRLFDRGIKAEECEMCGWAKRSIDGRLPLELDHINGNRHDNRLENLRVLCPNCHSLQPTHRGRNRIKNKPI